MKILLSKLKERAKNFFNNFSAYLLALLAFVLVIGIWKNLFDPENGFWYDFLVAVVGAIVTMFAITLPYDFIMKRKRKKEDTDCLCGNMSKAVFDSMGADDGIIRKYYANEESIKRIVENCGKATLNRDLSHKLIALFDLIRHVQSYRSNFRYIVNISSKKELDIDSPFWIEQTLSYTKHLKKNVYDSNLYTLSCYFSFRKNPFLHRGRGEVLFLREELSSDSLIEYLINHSNDKEEIIRCLGYSVSICPDEVGDSDDDDFDCFKCAFYTVRLEDLTVELVYTNDTASGIKIKCSVPETAVRDRGEFCTFQARIKCKYSTGLQEFYFKVPEFTQDAHVDIKLDNNTSQLHIVSFADNYKERQYIDNGFYFDPINENDKTLLPNNGFTAVW